MEQEEKSLATFTDLAMKIGWRNVCQVCSRGGPADQPHQHWVTAPVGAAVGDADPFCEPSFPSMRSSFCSMFQPCDIMQCYYVVGDIQRCFFQVFHFGHLAGVQTDSECAAMADRGGGGERGDPPP